jgi:hypothetical protein
VHNDACACAVAVETTGTVPVVSMPFSGIFDAIFGQFQCHFWTVSMPFPDILKLSETVPAVSKCPDCFKMSGETALKLNPNLPNISTITRDV